MVIVSLFKSSPRRPVTSAAPAWCVLIALLMAGCAERVDITGTAGSTRSRTGTGTGATSGTGTVDTRLVGRWSRTVLIQDNGGSIHASRTSWRFGSDASATRAVVASNLTFGLVDSVVTQARWRVQNGGLIVTYLAPSSGEARFDYRLQGATLILGGLAFDRQ